MFKSKNKKKGQTNTEYILILVIVSMIFIKVKGKLLDDPDALIPGIADKVKGTIMENIGE